METKFCKKCGTEKELHFFYSHSQMKDGKLNICIECTKNRISEREKKLKENPNWVEKEQERQRKKYHRLNKNWKKPDGKYRTKVNSEYRQRYPEKHKARNKAQRIQKQKGNVLHHWSYNEIHWKDIIELSKKDHAFLHRHIEYVQELKLYKNKKTDEILETKESHINLLNSLK